MGPEWLRRHRMNDATRPAGSPSGTRKALIWTPGREAENKDGKDYGRHLTERQIKQREGQRKAKIKA